MSDETHEIQNPGSGPRERTVLEVVIHLVSIVLRLSTAAAAERVRRLAGNLVASAGMTEDEAIACLGTLDRGQLATLLAQSPAEQARAVLIAQGKIPE
jgi:hypothetical protein